MVLPHRYNLKVKLRYTVRFCSGYSITAVNNWYLLTARGPWVACIEMCAYAHARCMWHALVHSARITYLAPLFELKPSPCPFCFMEARSWVDKAALMPCQCPWSHGHPGDVWSYCTSMPPQWGCGGCALCKPAALPILQCQSPYPCWERRLFYPLVPCHTSGCQSLPC